MNKTFYSKASEYIKKYYPFLIFFILILVLHLFMGFYADDVYFSKVLSKWSLSGFLKWRYFNWTSRIIQDAAMVILSRQNLLIWKILDSIIYTIGVYYLIKLVNKSNNKKIIIFGILLFLIYPFYEMGSAGWLATTLTYLWPFSLGMISFVPLINEYSGEKTGRFTYVISILASVYAVNHEQSCALIFGFSVLYLINSILKKKNINNYNIILILISTLSLFVIFTSPGVPLRYATQINKLPEFASLEFVEKAYLGFVPTIGILLTDKILFPLFYLILSISTLLKTKNKYLKYILYFNVIFISFIMVYKILFDMVMLQDLKLFMTLFGNNNLVLMVLGGIKSFISMLHPVYNTMLLFNYKGVPKVINISVILTLFISFYLLLSSCLMLFKTFDRKLFPVIIFGAGFISRFIMGFSPEIFSSGARTIFYFYISLIMLTLMLINKLYDDNRINNKIEKIMIISFMLLAIIEYAFVLILTIFVM